jgi:hypothetical protein
MRQTPSPVRIAIKLSISAATCATVLCVAPAAHARPRSPAAVAATMVLTGPQVGSGFSQQQESFTPAQLAQQGTWTRAQLRAWGYQGGFERVFDRDFHTANGEQIASNAGVYRNAAGARQSLIANGNQCTVGPWQILPTPRHLGNQAVFCTQTGIEHGFRGQLFFLVWRVGRFKGSISLSGVTNHVNAAEAVALARRQAVKM